jgi:NADPH:quinone reductase-like Zn-dependent oxidoreductase
VTLLLDIAGGRSWREYRRVLEPKANLVIVGAPKGTRLLGPLSHVVKLRVAAVRSGRKVVLFLAKFDKPDMAVLGELLETGKVAPVVDRRYELTEIAEAFRYLGEGHAQGKLAVTV